MLRRNFIKYSFSTLIGITLSKIGFSNQDWNESWEEVSNQNNEEDFVILYDTYAMALYMDGGLGPKTGVVKVDYILENKPVPMVFWHGHGGKSHEYTLLPEHFKKMTQLEKVTIETTFVEGHNHKLFVDMKDPKWRVPGAQPVKVPKSVLDEVFASWE